MTYTIAIVGRANVGKTTIFNRLVGKKASAIVANFVGTTRDRNEVETDYYGITAKFVDAAGIEYQNTKGAIAKQMLNQAINSIDLADLCVFVVDGKNGITSGDLDVFNLLRKKNKTTILVVNKAENPQNIDVEELAQFNIVCDKILLSAEHNLGFGDLYNAIKNQYDVWLNQQSNVADDIDRNNSKEKNNNADNDGDDANDNHKIRIAVLGRPNAGKSTFLNNLLNEERLITSDVAGTTRDKIELNFSYNGSDFVLIDTAGIRKKHKNGDEIETASVEKSLEALQFADIAVVMMDITGALEEQDLSLCQQVCNEGRILVVCFNKWDLVPSDKEEKLIEDLKKIVQKSIAQVKGVVFFTCSAIRDKNLTLMLDTMVQLYNKWNTKFSASTINRKIEEAKLTMNIVNELKIRYINQIKVRPPTFIAFSGKNEKDITIQKIENLKKWLYRELDLTGVPIRLSTRGKGK